VSGGGGRRLERVKDLLREVGAEILRDIKDPAVANQLVSITEVVVTPDLSYAKFRVSILAEPDAQRAALEGLNRAAGYVRRELMHKVHMKKIPQPSFELDDSLERATRMSALLAKAVPSANDADDGPEGASDGPPGDQTDEAASRRA
jgi:ribosome-binding factor A